MLLSFLPDGWKELIFWAFLPKFCQVPAQMSLLSEAYLEHPI